MLVFFCAWQQIIADDPPTLVQSQDRKEILVDANDPRVSAYLQDHQIETRPYSEDRIWADVSDEEYQELLQSQVKSEVMAEYIYASGEPQSPGLLECYAQVYGSQSSDVSIPDVGGWVNSVINITHGPEGAVVDRFDCHVEIVHTYVGDLVVDVGNNQDTIWRRLWDRNGGSDDNINNTWYSISGLHG